MKKSLLVSLLALVILFSFTAGALSADPEIKMRVAMAIPSTLPLIDLVPKYAKMVELLSDGTIKMKIFEPGKLIPAFEILETRKKFL